ncbi:hypothetical protein [Paracoccus sp. Ld10]|uniref:hypothetical protein n=1 Tax=Paracoccus sp. Ld10 TaxID=649158 RepID=UPI00386A107F
MVEVIFHIGMGKTGTTSLQHVLRSSNDVLQSAGIRYLGMWQELISEQYCDYVGFQEFRQLPVDKQPAAAERLAQQLTCLASQDGTDRFLFSNEQYFENIDHLHPFFDRLRQLLTVRFFLWVRPADAWLPSACAQWGILHKTNYGPVQPFVDQADRLIQQYRHVATWKQLFGDSVTIRPFIKGVDPVSDFAEQIGLPLAIPQDRRQIRPNATDLMLRAAFNTQFDGMVLPNAFNEAIGRHRSLTTAQGLQAKADLLLGHSSMPQVIAKHRDLLDQASDAAGFDVAGTVVTQDYLPTRDELVDGLLGRAVEIIAGQARDLAEMRDRLNALEARLAQ